VQNHGQPPHLLLRKYLVLLSTVHAMIALPEYLVDTSLSWLTLAPLLAPPPIYYPSIFTGAKEEIRKGEWRGEAVAENG
jgi:hypothetical protein